MAVFTAGWNPFQARLPPPRGAQAAFLPPMARAPKAMNGRAMGFIEAITWLQAGQGASAAAPPPRAAGSRSLDLPGLLPFQYHRRRGRARALPSKRRLQALPFEKPCLQ